METAFRSDERFTQDEFFAWLQLRPPGDINHYELLDGYVVMTPPAGAAHASIGVKIATELELHVRRTRAGRVYDATAGYELPSGDTVEPDVSFVSLASLERGPAIDPDRFLRVVPDLVVEVLSPSTSKRDGTEKKRIYERNGVSEYWIVDPKARRLVIFRLAGGKYAAPLEVAGGEVEATALPGLSFPLASIFRDCD